MTVAEFLFAAQVWGVTHYYEIGIAMFFASVILLVVNAIEWYSDDDIAY